MAGSIDAGAISYEQRRASVQLDVPERFNFTADVFEPWADTDAVAMLWFDDAGAERRISYRELSERANRLANVLRSQGVSKGDRVFIMVGRIPEGWEAMLACLKIGAVSMPATMQLQPKDIAYRIESAEPAAVITEPAATDKFDAVRSRAPSVNLYLSTGAGGRGWLSCGA